MADFAFLATVMEEWETFAKTWNPPAPPAGATLQEIRHYANSGAAKNNAVIIGRPEKGLSTAGFEIPTDDSAYVPVRIYIPSEPKVVPTPLYIHLHGGGYHLGTLETEDPWCRQIAVNTGFAVLNVNYRHTPEFVFPTPVNDAWTAFKWAQATASQHKIDPEKIYVGGTSAGATLALTIALRAVNTADTHTVKGLILNVPATVHPDLFPVDEVKDGFTSLQQNADAPFINAAKLARFTDLYKPDAIHPWYSPLLLDKSAFSGLCPTFFHIAGRDPLRDEGLLLEKKMREAGVETQLHTYPGLPHSFMSLPQLPSSAKWRESVLKTLGDI